MDIELIKKIMSYSANRELKLRFSPKCGLSF